MNLEEVLKDRPDAGAIRAAYCAPSRRYHNLDHLREMLRWIPDEETAVAKEPLIDAVLYHDFVHLPYFDLPPAQLEAMSILHFGAIGKMPIRPAVGAAIIATAFHHIDQPNLILLAQQLCDLDMVTFAYPRDEFTEISNRVLEEYRPNTGEEAFLEKNGGFLRALLKRKAIYYQHPEWEKPARDNIQWRLTEWRSPAGKGYPRVPSAGA